MPAGRPKTPMGHHDDAMLEIMEFRGMFAEFMKVLRADYCKERDMLAAIDERLRNGALSLRYSEIMGKMIADAADEDL